MKKLLLFLILITGAANAQIINFPDPNFKAALMAPTYAENLLGLPLTSVDANSDGNIEVSEALDVAILRVNNASIVSFANLQAFLNLKQFSCAGNLMIDLDLTGLTALEVVDCSHNTELAIVNASGLPNLVNIDYTINPNLASLDFSECTMMGTINITQNTFGALDISNSGIMGVNINSTNFSYINLTGCQSLGNLSIWSSQLSSISLENLSSLFSVTLYGNPQLSSINVVNCPEISYLYCQANNLSTLDFTNLQGLTRLYCADNHLTTLDVSSLTHLIELVCTDNQLESLNIKNGQNETTVLVAGNPDLAFICADEGQIGAVQTVLNNAGMVNTVCNSYCNFTPGGPFNTITGNLKLDNNNNGCDAGDMNPINIRIDATDGTNSNTSFVNTNGVYRLYVPAGDFTLTPSVENPTYFNFSPVTETVSFPDSNFNVEVKNFCVTPNGSHEDLEVVIAPIAFARPGFNAIYQIVYKNKGNQTMSQANGISFTYNDTLMDFVSASAATSSTATGMLTWDYSDLLPFESRSILVTMHINPPTDVNPVNIGNVLQYHAAILPSIADETVSDNTFQFDQTVVGAYDPNDITCIEGTVVSPAEIGNYLHYVINFENTGTFPAENIVVKTQIDTAKFDINSLQLLNASHAVNARISGNVVEFIFETVNLTIGGHGHILLKIKTKDDLVVGDVVSKRADIFFDYNFPVDTGFANTTFQTLSAQGFDKDPSIALYPNPTRGIFAVKADHAIKSIALYDVQGRILLTHMETEKESSIDITAYPKGIYFVKVQTADGIKIEKVVHE